MLWIISGLFLLSSCNETLEPDYSRFGYNFFPLKTGMFRVYNVSEILFNEGSFTDTLVYELKEYVSDSIEDNSGEISYILQRFRRDNGDQSWQLDSLWSAYISDIRATVYENNIPVIKLVFPFMEELEWDSNGLNSRNMDEFRMKNVFDPYSSTFGDYPHTVTVMQEEKLDSIISLDYRYEIYAENIGLIEKFGSKLDFCKTDDCRGQKIINEGRIITQRLVEYGTE